MCTSSAICVVKGSCNKVLKGKRDMAIYWSVARLNNETYPAKPLRRNHLSPSQLKKVCEGQGAVSPDIDTQSFTKTEREILFEATRTCVWLKFDVCSMRVRFATQQRDTSGLINHQVKYFAKANSAFAIFLHKRHGRFIVYQFKTVSLLSNRVSKVTKRIPSSSSSSSFVTSPSSTTRLDSAERSN